MVMGGSWLLDNVMVRKLICIVMRNGYHEKSGESPTVTALEHTPEAKRGAWRWLLVEILALFFWSVCSLS